MTQSKSVTQTVTKQTMRTTPHVHTAEERMRADLRARNVAPSQPDMKAQLKAAFSFEVAKVPEVDVPPAPPDDPGGTCHIGPRQDAPNAHLCVCNLRYVGP